MNNPESPTNNASIAFRGEDAASVKDIAWLTPAIGFIFGVGTRAFTGNDAMAIAAGISAAGAFLGFALAEHAEKRVKALTDQAQPLKAKLDRNLAYAETALAGGIAFGAIGGLVSNRLDFTLGGMVIGGTLGVLMSAGKINEVIKGQT